MQNCKKLPTSDLSKNVVFNGKNVVITTFWRQRLWSHKPTNFPLCFLQ